MAILSIRYGQISPGAKADATFSIDDEQDWANISDFGIEGIEPPKVPTLELDYVPLDGSFEREFPNNPHLPIYQWGWWTESQSDDKGDFENPPVLDITLTRNHKSPGWTFYFYPYTEDYASRIRATTYNSAGIVITSDVYELSGDPREDDLYIEEAVEDYQRVVFEFLSTNKPHRFLKILGMDFGIVHRIRDEFINTAQILEEVDPIGDILSINTFNFQWKTHTPIFNPVSGAPEDNMLMKKQPLFVSSGRRYMGTFFLENWKDIHNTGTTFNFDAIDAIGVLDKYEFLGGIYNNVSAEVVIKQIVDLCFPTGLIEYVLDDELRSKTITGWIPISTCRQALQQICFAIGAVADTGRRNYIWIYPRDKNVTFELPKEVLYMGGDIEPTDYVSGVDVNYYSYVRGNEPKEEFKGELKVGTHLIRFNEPLWALSITGGTIVSSGDNWAEIQVTTQGEVILSGNQYVISEVAFSLREEVEAGEVESIVEFTKCRLVTINNVETIAENLFDYLKQRLTITNSVTSEALYYDEDKDLEVGYVARMGTYGRDIIGTIESMNIDLRAEKANVKVTGSVDLNDNNSS